ncbi:MAG: hypothetical protein OIN66_14710 [Candidatus Methanoperedens sp.]|nr:hypothetical protein [Candidatus Methanoperedens sp.]
MKVRKRGGEREDIVMITVQCSICGMDMDCPESMLSADRHFCERCTDLLAEGYEPEELKMDKKSLGRHFARCDEVAEKMLDIAFYEPFAKVQEQGMEHYNYEALAKMFFLQGASSMLGLLISTGMPPPFLDDLEEAIKEAKRGMGEGK